MKRDFSIVLVGLAGQQFAELVEGEQRPMTLGVVSINALLGQFADETSLAGEEKFRRYKIAERVSTGGIQDVSAEEVSLIKKLIGKAYAPMIVGPAYEALERDVLEAQAS